ncbi:right-handed parallel beta-helix repeat-containing protein [Anaerorhabdus sp.]|uniref:right-handed parallel beta-helix repeat-containing protein n=2 Tax=Anaerorhabdus sp. TaxID=1872524 RepID=UPI002FC841A2
MKKIGIISLVFFVMFASTQVIYAEETKSDPASNEQIVEENNTNENQDATKEEVNIEDKTGAEAEASNNGTVEPVVADEKAADVGNVVTNVAQVNGVDYATLAQAIEAAPADGEITLLADAKVDGPIVISKNLTINGANNSIEATYTGTSGNQTILTASGNVTVKIMDATISNSPKYGVQAFNSGKVVLNNVTFSNNAYSGVLVNGGSLVIEGPVSISGGNGVGIELAKGNNVTTEPTIEIGDEVKVDGSNDLSKVIYIDRNQVEEVSQNTITATQGSNITVDYSKENGFDIKKDGTSIAAPSFPQGDILVLVNGNVVKAFSSLEEAILGADAGSTIEIQKDLNIAAPIAIKKNLILDGKGKTLTATYTGTSGDKTILTSWAAVTIKNMTLKNSPKYGIQVFGGDSNTKIENVIFDNNNYGAILINGGSAEVSDVKFEASQTTGIELGRGTNVTTPSNLKISGKIEATNSDKAIYTDLAQVTSHEQSAITSSFYEVSTDSNGLITLKKDGVVAFVTAGNAKPVVPNKPNTPSTWDDGGPFTTDKCGNIFDRWGNEIYKVPTCKASSGYKVPNTGVR